MKTHSKFGKVVYWFGFLLFIMGFMFNEKIGILAKDIPETFHPFSLPAIIIGILIILISNFYKRVR